MSCGARAPTGEESMYQFVFFDLDDTLLDFQKAEAIAVAKALQSVGVSPTEALIYRYSQVNKQHWQRLGRGELTREQVLVQRFAALFQEQGIDTDPAICRTHYEDLLCQGHYFIDGAQEILSYLAPKYRLYLASNGTAKVQDSRLRSAGISAYFQDIFISERLGANKPSLSFFQKCFARIPDFRPEQALIIGDSLTSDIQGGNNAGISTCWLNPKGASRPTDLRIDWEIRRLCDLKTIL